MSDLKFEPVALTGLMEHGVLMAANERVFWPLGLALTWDYDKDTGLASNLHVRQWSHPEGEQERIDLDFGGDPVGEERRRAFAAYVEERFASMKPDEAVEGRLRLVIPLPWAASPDKGEPRP